jgi:predicted nuclease of predicted toxin-antitoxin system
VRFLFDHDVPDDLAYLLRELGHIIIFVREVMERTSADVEVLAYAYRENAVMVTCNRDDFLGLAQQQPHRGIVIVIRRQTRTAERTAFFRLLERAGEAGLSNNINFA